MLQVSFVFPRIPTAAPPAPPDRLRMRPFHPRPARTQLPKPLAPFPFPRRLQRPVFLLRPHRQPSPRCRPRAVLPAGTNPALAAREVDRRHWLAPLLLLMPGDALLPGRAHGIPLCPMDGKVAGR